MTSLDPLKLLVPEYMEHGEATGYQVGYLFQRESTIRNEERRFRQRVDVARLIILEGVRITDACKRVGVTSAFAHTALAMIGRPYSGIRAARRMENPRATMAVKAQRACVDWCAAWNSARALLLAQNRREHPIQFHALRPRRGGNHMKGARLSELLLLLRLGHSRRAAARMVGCDKDTAVRVARRFGISAQQRKTA